VRNASGWQPKFLNDMAIYRPRGGYRHHFGLWKTASWVIRLLDLGRQVGRPSGCPCRVMHTAHKPWIEVDSRSTRIFGNLPGVIRDDLRRTDPLDGSALPNRTSITR